MGIRDSTLQPLDLSLFFIGGGVSMERRGLMIGEVKTVKCEFVSTKDQCTMTAKTKHL